MTILKLISFFKTSFLSNSLHTLQMQSTLTLWAARKTFNNILSPNPYLFLSVSSSSFSSQASELDSPNPTRFCYSGFQIRIWRNANTATLKKTEERSWKNERKPLCVCFALLATMADLKKEGILTYAYLLLYIALSSGQIFFNKVFSPKSQSLWTLNNNECPVCFPGKCGKICFFFFGYKRDREMGL